MQHRRRQTKDPESPPRPGTTAAVALRLLARRDHTIAELRAALVDRGHAIDEVESAIDRFTSDGSLDDRRVRRAGLDYWTDVDLCVWRHWDQFEQVLPSLGEPYFFSTKATRLLWDVPLGAASDVVLIFGRETGGLPSALHERYRDRFVGMPMESPLVRSLNLSTSVAVAVYEVLRQRRARSASNPS